MNRAEMAGMALAIASAALGAAGLAQTRPLTPTERLGALRPLDRDLDGRVSAAEWSGAGRKPAAFQRMDRNKDGYLTSKEAKSRRGGSGE
jgi:hypothetical protein